MEKILKKYTTIPEHLYVNRSADKQLKRIIEEMQRPGYVLVARQMGKTNLLFNAKRILENKERIFAYVDLSNLYDNERDCYRNIINNIIEPNIDTFGSIEEEIESIRQKNLPPHNEYSRSLRVILNHFKGDLVIILDEIDALKSIEYSDNIFAQIRSNYFSRTNYPVFERLTYVLSGVIEPTELIKDRNKSPFNIGDKIYLDDFSKDEHNDFIHKSKLKITKELSEEIYNWTNGNPRLTFDICSEIESFIINDEELDTGMLEQIIKNKYLTTFDIAPIDHIRELVKTNKQIRNSIKQIHKNNSKLISDDIKKKLYLYGIINSKFDEKTKIKNKIIEKSLSEEWIKSIDKDNEISIMTGLFKYDNKEFDEAIEVFENFILNPNSSKKDLETANYFIGLSYFQEKEYEKAAVFFSKDFDDESYSNDCKSFIGICKIGMGFKNEGIEILEESVKNETHSPAYNNALLNLAINTEDNEKGLMLFKKLYDSTFKTKNETEEELNRLRSLSLFYQVSIYLNNNGREEALSAIEKSFENTNIVDTLYFIYLKHLLTKDNSLKTALVEIIINNELKFDLDELNPLIFNAEHLYKYFDLIYDETDMLLFDKLLEYATDRLFLNTSKYEIVYRTSQISSTKEKFLLYLDKFASNISENLSYRIYKDLCFQNIGKNEAYIFYFNKYLPYFTSNPLTTSNDVYLFAFVIKMYSDTFSLDKAIELSHFIEQRINNTDDYDLKFESVIIYYWLSTLYFSLKNLKNAIIYSDIALELINNSKRKKTSMIDEKGLDTIKKQLIQIKQSSTIVQPIRHDKKYGRNDKVKVQYLDGKIIEKKYKIVEADILAERCVLI
jgi:hypothetical protein